MLQDISVAQQGLGLHKLPAGTSVDAYIAKHDTAGNCRSLLHFGEAAGRSIRVVRRSTSDYRRLVYGRHHSRADTISSFNAWDALVVP